MESSLDFDLFFDLSNYSYIYNETHCDEYDGVHLIGPILLTLLTLAGVVGNFALLAVILSTRHMRTAANVLIINLTIGDLFYIVCTAPFYIEREILPCADQPLWVCKMQSFFPIVGQGACVYSLAALSRERYGAIVHGIQLRQGSGKLRNALAVFIVWTVSFLIGIPVLMKAHKQSDTQCSELPAFTTFAKVYQTCRLLFVYLIPLIVIAVYYARMAQTLIQSLKGFGDSRTGTHQTEARRKLAVIILVVTVFFGVFWFPYYVYIVWYQFSSDYIESQKYSSGGTSSLDIFRNFHYIMALINSSLNPWCVFIMSSSYRRQLVQCICCGRFGKDTTTKTPTSSHCSGAPGGNKRRGSGGVSFTQITMTQL